MKNVTLSADEALIGQARAVARQRHTTPNAAFREWLAEYARQRDAGRDFDELMQRLRQDVRSSGPYTRDGMNER